MVSLVEAPRGLDLPVGSAALIDSDDVRLGLAVGQPARPTSSSCWASTDDEAMRWMAARAGCPGGDLRQRTVDALVAKAVAAGSAVVAVEPRARWERLYQLVNHVFEHHGDRGDPTDDSGTDLFGLAQSLADRIHGMVSIEDEQSHVLAYSASNDEADELRRLSILGRAGPPEHLEVDRPMGHLRCAAVQRRRGPRRRAPGVGSTSAARRSGSISRRCRWAASAGFAGTIWVQQGSQPLADDAEEMLRGARGAGRPHHVAAGGPAVDAYRAGAATARSYSRRGDAAPELPAIARELGLEPGIAADGRARVDRTSTPPTIIRGWPMLLR